MAPYLYKYVRVELPDVVKITPLPMLIIAHHIVYIFITHPKAAMKFIVMVCIVLVILAQKRIENVHIDYKVCFFLYQGSPMLKEKV